MLHTNNHPEAVIYRRGLNDYIRHYLDVVRPTLLAGRGSEALWICQHGQPLGAKALAARVFHNTGQRFAIRFGPHRFRHALSTTAVLSAPEHPGLAAGVLGISGPVIDRHYNLAGQIALSNTFANQIAARRKAYAAEAERRRLYPPGKPPDAAQRSAGQTRRTRSQPKPPHCPSLPRDTIGPDGPRARRGTQQPPEA